MNMVKDKERKGKWLISKTWERCKSLHGAGAKSSFDSKLDLVKRNKSWSRLDANKGKTLNIAPKGCFSVYVGPQRQRFVIRAEHANHPFFKDFLIEAEYEYGYRNQGPLELPCDVDDFVKVLLQMDDCYKVICSHQCMMYDVSLKDK